MRALTYLEQIENLILEMMSRGDLRPGERIDEVSFSNVLGVSRTPIRQALHQMSSSGLLEHRTNRGVFVPSLDHTQIVNLGEVRIALEVAASRAAIERYVGDAELETLTCEVRDAPDAPGEADFHRQLVGLSGNPELLGVWSTVNQRLVVARWLSGQRAARAADASREHKELVELLRQGDVAAIEEAIANHVRRGIQSYTAEEST